MDKTIKLKVRMMGGFDCVYNDQTVEFTGATSTKMVQLFIYLLYSYPSAIPLSNVIEALYEDSEVDTGNSFKALLFRLRNAISGEFKIPQDECIVLKGGMLKLSDRFEVCSDIGDFNKLYDSIQEEEDKAERVKILESLFTIYHGELLPMMSTVPWVIFENALLSDHYSRIVNSLCKYYIENNKYDDAHSTYSRAMVYFPFEEDWIIGSIDSLVSSGYYKQAMDEYERMSNIIFDEMGLYPSEKLLDAMRRISAEYANRENAIESFNETVAEDQIIGAYYANFPGFVNCYRMLQRIMKRDNVQSSLVLLTLTDKNGNVLKDMSDIVTAASNLRVIISKTLRKNDMYSRYSKNQMIVFLWNSVNKNVPVVIERLKECMDNNKDCLCYFNYEVLEDDITQLAHNAEGSLQF